MFSEYASHFLAQSQSRVVSRPDELQRTGRARPYKNQGAPRNPSSRSFLRSGDPYRPGASQISNFPFASRASEQAPLFQSADEFREEDDETEREREIADFYALQRSRRHFGDSNLKESSELDDDESQNSGQLGEGQSPYDNRPGNGKGIKSSWRGEKAAAPSISPSRIETVNETAEPGQGRVASPGSARARAAHLVDVGLEDSLRGNLDDYDPTPSEVLGDDPPIQRFRERALLKEDNFGFHTREAPTDRSNLLADEPRPASSTGSRPPSLSPLAAETSVHDAFWAHLFLISLAGLFATSFLVYLHTSTPSGDRTKWGDTIYFTVHNSFFSPGDLYRVPAILYSFSLYPFISSFKGTWNGSSFQDKAMRWGSIVPFLTASLWIYNVVRGRRAIGKATGVLEFSCRILAANPELLALGLAVLACVVSWTWIWMLMFTRVFLGGHLAGPRSFIIDLSSWWLGVYFVIIYLWSIGVIAGIQRAVTAATVSQWYFHRSASPAPTSRQVVQAAIAHATTTLFGTISCLLIPLSRHPLPISQTPLSLTYGAIHSQPLSASARGLSHMTILGSSATSTSLHPNGYPRSQGASVSLLSYRLSKLILHAARFMMSLALGFGGWVTTARSLTIAGTGGTIRGSLYAYVVGLIAGTIGWSILGAMESVIADIVDASVICWASEVGTHGRDAQYQFCREAHWLFGDSYSSSRPEYQGV
ncbi:hypothetical protein N7468_004918 [Penicillium chermesinum]|uniref:Protein PNS1 n=1 Tax=Penicillium chermesinum TaxID=63820 RepID=A0A9W9NYA9_9EURO|nr:uncharacterized protein N7468_004918 [Penicillium chermesinum]KAJ5231962.1 hypothetical protein N7468_004918 [Penicillium chermesinum]